MMIKFLSAGCFLSVSIFSPGYSQTDSIVSTGPEYEVYTINKAVEISILAPVTLYSAYTLQKIFTKPRPSEEEILRLKKSDIPGFDRWAVYPYSKTMSIASGIPFYTSIPLPLIFFLTGADTRNDYGQLAILYWETLAAIGLTGTTATAFVERYRPYAYFHDTREQMDQATDKLARNSFYAGHVQIVAASTFFIAKVYSDYHPESKVKWMYFGSAAVISSAEAYMRLRGGQHFPSDVLIGLTTGTLAGILVPHLHKKGSGKKNGIGILPYHNGTAGGLILTYTVR